MIQGAGEPTIRNLKSRIEDRKGHRISNFGDLLLQDIFVATKSDVIKHQKGLKERLDPNPNARCPQGKEEYPIVAERPLLLEQCHPSHARSFSGVFPPPGWSLPIPSWKLTVFLGCECSLSTCDTVGADGVIQTQTRRFSRFCKHSYYFSLSSPRVVIIVLASLTSTIFTYNFLVRKSWVKNIGVGDMSPKQPRGLSKFQCQNFENHSALHPIVAPNDLLRFWTCITYVRENKGPLRRVASGTPYTNVNAKHPSPTINRSLWRHCSYKSLDLFAFIFVEHGCLPFPLQATSAGYQPFFV